MAASQQFKLLVQVEDPLRRNFYLEIEDGRWKMEDGRWKMEDGRWEATSWQFKFGVQVEVVSR